MALIYKIQKYLEDKGFDYNNVSQYIEVSQDYAGAEVISMWDGDNIGTDRPGMDELNAINDEEALLHLAKKEKISEIAVYKDIALYANVEFNGATYIASNNASANISGALLLSILNSTTEHTWLDANDNPIVLSVAQLTQLGNLIATQRNTAYTRESILRNQIRNASTIEEVNAITWAE